MNSDLNLYIEKSISKLLSTLTGTTSIASGDGTSDTLFDKFIEICRSYYDKPVHNFTEMRMRMNKKLRGDIFEHFCVKYLEVCGISRGKGNKGLDNVWLLGDVPQEILDKLSLKRNDVGIDIIAEDSKCRYYAVQAKYRKRNKYKSKNVLGWKSLSTFYAMAHRSGPYYKHVVMTTADYVRHPNGKRDKKDWSICLKSFRNTDRMSWVKMAQQSRHRRSLP